MAEGNKVAVAQEPPKDNSRLLSNLRHSLMNPLTVIMGYAQMIAAREDVAKEVREQASTILAQAQECARILSEGPSEGVSKAAPPKEAPRVLVVDDDPMLCRLVAEALRGSHEVVTATTATEALQRLSEGKFDAIIIDLHLEGPIDGKGLFREISKLSSDQAKHVIVTSGGLFTEDDVNFVRECGCLFLEKPFNVMRLRAIVAKAASL